MRERICLSYELFVVINKSPVIISKTHVRDGGNDVGWIRKNKHSGSSCWF